MKRQELLVLLDEAYEEPDKHVRSIEVQVRLTELAQLEWAPEEWELKRELRHNANWGARFVRTATWAECVLLATDHLCDYPEHVFWGYPEHVFWGDRARALTEGRQPLELDERDVQTLRWWRTRSNTHEQTITWCNRFMQVVVKDSKITSAFEAVQRVFRGVP